MANRSCWTVFVIIVPTAFTAVCMGMSAVLVSLLALGLPSSLGLQISSWILGSCGFVVAGYQIDRQRISVQMPESTAAEALTAMMPNQTGRVLYEGGSWRAKCADSAESIAPDDKLYVIGREGNLLIVMPIHLSEIG